MTTETLQIAQTKSSAQFPLVMIVDDSEITNYINEKSLKQNNFSEDVLVYENSLKAFEYLLNAEMNGSPIPSMLFLDLNMPLMDGEMFLKQFENLSSKVKSTCKVVILSSSGNPKDRVNMLSNRNVIAYFSPPLIKTNLDQLTQILKNQNQLSLEKPNKTKFSSGMLSEFLNRQQFIPVSAHSF